MIPEDVLNEIIDHNITFLEKSHPQFHDMPVCPFAKKARIDEQIVYDVYDPDRVQAQIEAWRTTDKQVLVLVILNKEIPLEEYLVHLESIKAILPADLVVFEGHPQSTFFYNHVLTRREPYPNFQFNRVKEIEEAENHLHHSGWYKQETTMGGVSLSTAIIIQCQDTTIQVVGPIDGKYGWHLDAWKNGSIHTSPLLSVPPHYDTPEEAEAAANEVVKMIKAHELSN